ncbi:hypothetical protein [Epilithonimonas sp.]|uniref:hypothetical protein n=1 Tax=Epilithonimonas sp. TaxID=2894511 RepID=UPI0028ADB7C9|nr:hypothetical protein [Epilithonimonas sp.]
MNNNQNLLNTIASDSIELIGEYAEIAADAFIESEVIQDIPIFGSIIKISKIGLTMRDYLFVEKLKSFLLTLNKVSEIERKKFIKKHLNNDDKINNVGEKIFNVIDKIDTTQKAKYVGRIFNLYIEEIITEIEFYDLIYTVENFKIHYTDLFISACINIESDHRNQHMIDHFVTCGLFNNKENIYIYTDNEPNYSSNQLSKIGKIFLERVLSYDKSKIKEDFINKLLSIKKHSFIEEDKWEYYQEINLNAFKSYLDKKELTDFLNIRVYDSFLTIRYKRGSFGVFKSDDPDTLILYKRKRKIK